MTQLKSLPRFSDRIDTKIDQLITKQNESYSNWRSAQMNKNHDAIKRNAASFTSKKPDKI